jgi:large subunit ribosomal protein L9
MKASAVRRQVKEKGDAELLAKQFEGVALEFVRKAGENGQLFGSVTPADLAHELERHGFNIDRRKLQLDDPLKTVGEFSVKIKLHRDVTAQVKVAISREQEPEAAKTPAAKTSSGGEAAPAE